MKIEIYNEDIRHTDIVNSVGWIGNNELYSCGDDQKILQWSGEGEYINEAPNGIIDLNDQSKSINSSLNKLSASKQKINVNQRKNVYFTSIQWFPIKGKAGTEIYAISSTDGNFYLCSKNGRVEKIVEAHYGALLSMKWNYDGSALATAGEDGQLKIWSRSGMLRSVLIQLSNPIYSISWSPDNDKLIMTNEKNLLIKPLQPSQKHIQWKAHDGVILSVEWSSVNNLIVSGGEDKKYKVWDSYGRQIYSSGFNDQVITSVSWSPSGEMFAVGSFNSIRVCDKLGWSYGLAQPNSGSILDIAWTPDSTQFACAGGNGAVCFGYITERRMEWKNYEIIIPEQTKIIVHDVLTGTKEQLDFRDHVIKASIRFGYLIVATSSQCYIYSEKNWNTPSIIDLSNNGRVVVIQQSQNYFSIVDNLTGIQVYNYEGRHQSSPKYQGLRPEFITAQTYTMSDDTIAIIDKTDEKSIIIFETTTGRLINKEPLRHHQEILEIGLNLHESSYQRQLVIIDKNRDMYITPINKSLFKKLGSMVDSLLWNDESNTLAAIMDGKFVVWYYPNVVFVDEEITHLTRFEKEGYNVGKSAQLVKFIGSEATIRKSDGSLVVLSDVSPYPALLHELVKKKQWEEAIRLCRFAKLEVLWACLAAMAVAGHDLNTAEVAYALINEVVKVEYICYIKEIPTVEGRNAEFALLRHQPYEAEKILLSASLKFRAIKMWIDLFNWDRALDIAVKYKTNVDTVLYLRSKYLEKINKKETNKRFLQYASQVQYNPETVLKKIEQEMERERGINKQVAAN